MKINNKNLILSAAIGYNWDKLKIFVKSLRKYSNDRVIFIVNRDLDKKMRDLTNDKRFTRVLIVNKV